MAALKKEKESGDFGARFWKISIVRVGRMANHAAVKSRLIRLKSFLIFLPCDGSFDILGDRGEVIRTKGDTLVWLQLFRHGYSLMPVDLDLADIFHADANW